MKHPILYILFFFLFPVGVSAQPDKNPLPDQIGKEYGEYFEVYEALRDSLFHEDSLWRVEYVRLFTEAAAADPTGEWELNRRMEERDVRFYESRKGGFIPSDDYTAEDFAQDCLEIAADAGRQGFPLIRLRALFKAADVYRIYAHAYERAMGLYLEVVNELDKWSQREFPLKFDLLQELGNFYFSFREYEDASWFFRRIVEDPEVADKNNLRIYPALNGLGVSYRYQQKYDLSDSCFMRILELADTIELDKDAWEGIAQGNIGYNHYLRGDYERALAWMEPALEKMKRAQDDDYASLLASDIANIHLRRGDLLEGKKYLDTALEYHKRTRKPEKSSHLLGTLARYHAVASGKPIVNTYLDSTLRAKSREDEAFSGLVLRRVEQNLRAADQKVHERELGAAQMRTKMYKRTSLLMAIAWGVILILLLLVAFYYRRTHRAYRELVRKSQQWAGIPAIAIHRQRASDNSAEMASLPPPSESKEKTSGHLRELKNKDAEVMAKIERLMKEEQLYKNVGFKLDLLASQLNLNRYYVSGLLNRCSGKSLTAYINEYRVKEAIRIMSDPAGERLTIDGIAFESGFADRTSFYRAFKKTTGLSPSAFRKTIQMQ